MARGITRKNMRSEAKGFQEDPPKGTNGPEGGDGDGPDKDDNGPDPDVVREYNDAIQALLEKRESLAGAIMKEINELYDEAKDRHSIPKSLLREAVTVARQSVKRAKRREKLEPKEKKILERIELAIAGLKGTPLGDHALESAQAAGRA